MREIKFRAWGSHDVEYNWDTEDEFGKPIATYSDPSMIYFGIVNGLDEMHHNPSGLKIMQYTGLKDKNGVEIYEGDILRLIQHEYNEQTHLKEDSIREVIYREYGFCCAIEVEGALVIAYFDCVDLKLCEVIGNIYENKDLLDGKM